MKFMPDKYDQAIEFLTAHPEQIYNAWDFPHDHIAGSLFIHCKRGEFENDWWCGCLTQVKCGSERAQTYKLTQAIRADARIPESPDEITVESLPVFAEWQRRLDNELGRE